jgi:2-polyprenyl-6-methoxyphenol hydroxylase-like FAD-dependent oxidoreductase
MVRALDVVIVGGGLGGLAAALGLGRRGHRVRILERDPAPAPAHAEEAFGSWRRRGVPQWELYHVFGARARRELAVHAPDVLARLVESGAEDRDLSWLVAEDPRPDDAELRVLIVRRPVLEWALRTAVAAVRGVEVVAGVEATGLAIDGRVTGVRTNETTARAAVVIDAAGRRSPVRRWLREAGVAAPTPQRSACGVAYYSRYFQLRDGVDLPSLRGLVLERGDLGYMGYAIAPGDGRTYGVLLAAPADDHRLRALRHPPAWDAAARSIARVAEFVDPAVGHPIMPPAPMHGLENVLTVWAPEGQPLIAGLAAIGDAWATTDPLFGWGASLAIAQGFDVAATLDAGRHDAESAVVDFHRRHHEEIRQRFELACEDDRTVASRWGGRVGARTEAERDREAVLFACTRTARHDVHTRRALLRRTSLLDLPDELWTNEGVVARARDELELRPYDPDRHTPGPSRDEMLSTIAAAS